MKQVISFFHAVIFEGEIPLRSYLQKGLILLSCLTPFVIFFPKDFKDLGELSFLLLFAILAIRPLAQIFPKIKLFSSLLPFRKEVGILCGALAIAHAVGFFIVMKQNPISFVLDIANWQISSPFLYGIIALFIAFLLFITSNQWSMIILKQNWKRLHKLSYAFFFLAGIHAMLITHDYISFMLQMLLVLVLIILAARNIVIWK